MATPPSMSELRALALVPKFTAPLSITCSVFIVAEVLHEHRRNKGKVASRALLAMSVIDTMSSFGWFLSTWMAPKDTPDTLYAVGNTASCNFQGFLLQLAIGAPMYNSVLAVYYLLMIRFGWSERELRRIETYVHAFVLVFSVGTSILGLPLGLYNNIRSVCWVVGLPKDCKESTFSQVVDNPPPCERGHDAWIYGTVLFYAPLWICIIIAVSCMVAIWCHVRSLRKRNLTYDPSAATGVVTTGSRTISFTQTSVPQQEVAIQAILYTIAFIVAWLASTIWSLLYYFSTAQPTALDLLSGACEPLQGFWNFLVFIRPRRRLRAILRHRLCCGPRPAEENVRSMFSLGGRSSIDDKHHRTHGGHGYSGGASLAVPTTSRQNRIRRLTKKADHQDDSDEADIIETGKESSELCLQEDPSNSDDTKEHDAIAQNEEQPHQYHARRGTYSTTVQGVEVIEQGTAVKTDGASSTYEG